MEQTISQGVYSRAFPERTTAKPAKRAAEIIVRKVEWAVTRDRNSSALRLAMTALRIRISRK